MANHHFSELPPTPAQHFRLYFFAAVLHLLDQLTDLVRIARGDAGAVPLPGRL